MVVMIKSITLSIIILTFASCATTLKSNKYGDSGLYALTSDKMIEIAQIAMKEEFEENQISRLTEPEWTKDMNFDPKFEENQLSRLTEPQLGFKARWEYLLDYLDISIYVVEHGEKGYSFEIKTDGTALVTGNIKAQNIMRKAKALADSSVSK